MNRLEGCKIESLDNEACQAFLGWVTSAQEAAPEGSTFSWLLAHCQDGVTWGRFDSSNGCWLLSSAPFKDLCPTVCESNLLEMRIFGPESEILIWRTHTGLSGRRLIDESAENDNPETAPDDETRILLGDRMIEAKGGFTRVGTADGSEQVLPLTCTKDDFNERRWPLRLKVRHYFEQDKETGAVRVAATQLMDVFKEV